MTNTELNMFLIRVGQAGAWSASMQYDTVIDVYHDFNIYRKHVPLRKNTKQKIAISQNWPDEQGDDIWLPMSSTGKPVFISEAFDLKVDFVYHRPYQEIGHQYGSTNQIDALTDAIRGRWLQIYDYYSGVGYDGVILYDPEDDPSYKHRENGMDTVQFSLTFHVNGNRISEPFSTIATSEDSTLCHIAYDNIVLAMTTGVKEYTVRLSNDFTSPVTVTAQPKSDKATVLITQPTSVTGDATIKVISEDGKHTTNYTIHFVK